MRPIVLRAFALALSSLTALACQSGGHKTSMLVFGGSDAPQEDLVETVRTADEEALEARADFDAAFTLYQRVTTPQVVELDDLADDFADAIESCRERFEDLAARRAKIDKESQALFLGWNEELGRFSIELLREKSADMLADTEKRTERVTKALERLQTRMEPVVKKLEDYSLFFHHNLNPRAIATLQDTYEDFDEEYRTLTGELEKARAEIAQFLANFEGPRPLADEPAKK
jgi:chromosome segregation ATPase